MKNNKGDITVQTIFYILMTIVFVGILIFGFQKLFDVEKTLSEQERIEIKQYIKTSFDYCEDPLNKGNFKTFEIKNNLFNTICILGEDIKDSGNQYNKYEDFVKLYEAEQNVVMFDTSYKKSVDEIEFVDYMIIDSMRIDSKLAQTKCYMRDDQRNLIEVKISCE